MCQTMCTLQIWINQNNHSTRENLKMNGIPSEFFNPSPTVLYNLKNHIGNEFKIDFFVSKNAFVHAWLISKR